MQKKNSKKIGFISSFLPNQCGIATFTSDLITSLHGAASDNFEPLVVAMQPETTFQYTSPVKFEIRSKVKNDYISAADYINFSHVDVISLQHEFGLFGGSGGSHLNLLLHRVNAPVITTLHTVLEEPEPHYYQSMLDVCEASHKVIVMNQRGVSMLQGYLRSQQKKDRTNTARNTRPAFRRQQLLQTQIRHGRKKNNTHVRTDQQEQRHRVNAAGNAENSRTGPDRAIHNPWKNPSRGHSSRRRGIQIRPPEDGKGPRTPGPRHLPQPFR